MEKITTTKFELNNKKKNNKIRWIAYLTKNTK